MRELSGLEMMKVECLGKKKRKMKEKLSKN